VTPATASLKEYLRARREMVDAALERFLPAPPACPPAIAEAMRYSLFAGGKRLRPVLALAAAETVAGDRALQDQGLAPAQRLAIELALPAACALELIHTYSLVHDDLPAMDDDTLRRGRPTSHVVFGEGMAILAGDGLLTEAFALLARGPASLDGTQSGPEWEPPAGAPCDLAERVRRTIVVVAEAAGACGMVGGQAIDLQAAGVTAPIPLQGLRDMHARKTGALIRASAVAGAIMGGGSDVAVEAIGRYGSSIGLAFQIVDDILDVEGASEELGKTAGKDAAAGKPTYPALLGLEQSKRLAAEARDEALGTLANAGIHASRLEDIARWVVDRHS
jgi:geranylgeranyl diphosphate synthase type II